MHRSPRDNIAEVIYRFYDVEEIIKAKDALAVNYQGQFTYELKNRRNTKPSKTNTGKLKGESTLGDILSVMYELDKKKVKTSFVARHVSRIPKCDPKDVDPFANLQLIIKLQKRLKELEESVGSVHAQAISNKEVSENNSKSITDIETAVIQFVAKKNHL